MLYTLPDLPYAFNALEPYIDEQTVRLHHGKHHNGYVTKLNDALKGHEDLATKEIAELMPKLASMPADIRTAVRNNGAQHYNHSLYWECMGAADQAGGEPVGELALALQSTFGDFAKFKEQMAKAAAGCFGSGWAWLYLAPDGNLAITATSNEANPLMTGIVEKTGKPVLVVDVWEHAYYLKYQNRRPDYIEAWWHLVDWKAAAERFAKAKG
jgi:Fe-Mn family superoxide dismutase